MISNENRGNAMDRGLDFDCTGVSFSKTRAFSLSAIGEGKVFIQKIAHESDDLRAALRIVLAAARRAILGDESVRKAHRTSSPARVAGIRDGFVVDKLV